MCNRYTLESKIFAEHLAAINASLEFEDIPTGIMRPTHIVPIIHQHNDQQAFDLARWWLIPTWFKGEMKEWKAATFNARIETAAEKPTFKGAFKYGRCLIPATSYFEFTGDKPPKQLWTIRPQINAEYFYMAGLYTDWKDVRTCTIVTRGAHPDIQEIHHRQPAILDEEEIHDWLAGNMIEGNHFRMEFQKTEAATPAQKNRDAGD